MKRPWWITSLIVMSWIAGCISVGSWGYYFLLASRMGWKVPTATVVMACIQCGISIYFSVKVTKGLSNEPTP